MIRAVNKNDRLVHVLRVVKKEGEEDEYYTLCGNNDGIFWREDDEEKITCRECRIEFYGGP